jgi:hypothetical protein
MSWKKALKQSKFALPVLIPGVTHFQGSCIENGREIRFDIQGYVDPIELKWKATVTDVVTGTDAVYANTASKDTAMRHAMEILFKKIGQHNEGATNTTGDTNLSFHSPPPYQEGLQLSDLMNKVAAVVPDQWREVGRQLGVPPHVLDSFWKRRACDSMDCFSDVFTYWKDKCTRPYCWQTIIEVLQTPAVGQGTLAENLESTYMYCDT